MLSKEKPILGKGESEQRTGDPVRMEWPGVG